MVSKKAATNLTMDKIIVLILILLVIAAVLIGIFKGDIMGWIKKVPSYEPNPDNHIDIADLPLEQAKLLSAYPMGKITGEVDRYGFFKQAYLNIKNIENGRLMETGLYYDSDTGDSHNGLIKSYHGIPSEGVVFGEVKNDVISIVHLDQYNRLKDQYPGVYPAASNLALLAGTVIEGSNSLNLAPSNFIGAFNNIFKKFEDLKNKGKSNEIELRFDTGFFSSADLVKLYWNFNTNKTILVTQVNQNDFSQEDWLALQQILSASNPKQLTSLVARYVNESSLDISVIENGKQIDMPQDRISEVLFNFYFYPSDEWTTKYKSLVEGFSTKV